MTSLWQIARKKIIRKDHFHYGLILLILFSISLYAEINYLFPSDVIDSVEQREKAVDETNRTTNDTTQPNQNFSGKNWTHNSTPTGYYSAENYRYPEQAQRQYTDNTYYKNKTGPDSVESQNQYPVLLYASDLEPRNRPTRQENQQRLNSYQSPNNNRQPYQKERYARDIEFYNNPTQTKNDSQLNSFPEQRRNNSSKILYASDLEPKKRPIRQKNKAMLFALNNQSSDELNKRKETGFQYACDLESNRRQSNRQNNNTLFTPYDVQNRTAQTPQIRYVPVVVYNQPGSRQNTFPLNKSLHNYSYNNHLNTNYRDEDRNPLNFENEDLTILPGNQYNLLTHFGILP